MIQRPKQGLIKPHNSKLLVIGRMFDILVIYLTLNAVLSIQGMEWTEKQTIWLLISVIGFLNFAEFNELYRDSRGIKFSEQIKKIAVSWALMLMVFLCVDYFNMLIEPAYHKSFTLWCVAVPVEIISWHVILASFSRVIRKMGRNTRNVAVVGLNELAEEIQLVLDQEDWMGLNFVGFYDDRSSNRIPENQRDHEIKGKINDLIRITKNAEIDIVYIVLPLKAENRIKEILTELADTTASVYYVPDLFVFDLLRSTVSNLHGIPVISVYDSPFNGIDGIVKRCFDIIASLVILAVILVPLIMIAITIKVTSPGKIIFKQRRYGVNGDEIIVWKFRTMTVTEDEEKVTQATKNDSRVTPFGAFLRRTSMDEFPQFFNVLQGKMSIVGPRPHAVVHNEHYRGKIKGYMLRHKVKPGITGLAQIKGFRGETDTLDKMENRVRCDLEYIRNWTLLLDIKIILITMIKGFFSSKAY